MYNTHTIFVLLDQRNVRLLDQNYKYIIHD